MHTTYSDRTTYKLDSNLLIIEQVGAFEQYAKGALANLLADAVVHAYDVGRRRGHGSGAEKNPLRSSSLATIIGGMRTAVVARIPKAMGAAGGERKSWAVGVLGVSMEACGGQRCARRRRRR
jgi:hypothetical protein